MRKIISICFLGIFLIMAVDAAAMMSGSGMGMGGNAGGYGGFITRTIIGTATMGIVDGATVKAFSINRDGTRGALMGIGRTDARGTFSMTLSDYLGPMMLEMRGGHYIDNATGLEMDMLTENSMTAAIPYVGSSSMMINIQITPMTSMAQKLAETMTGGMTTANIARSNIEIGRFFGIGDILLTPPMDTSAAGSLHGADEDMRNYGMVLGAMSQYADMQGLINSSDIIASMMTDVSDGQIDGMAFGSPVMMGGNMMMPVDTVMIGLAEAMIEFINSPMNHSGASLEDMQKLVDSFFYSDGRILDLESRFY